MKMSLTIIASIIGAFGVVVVTIGLVAHGQSLTANAAVPFDFFVGKTPMHAGNYTLRPTSFDPGEILLKDDEGKSASLFIAFPLDKDSGGETKLVFHRYGGEYFLSQVWNGTYKLGLPKSERERELTASNAVTVEVVLIARK
jgi:hypothetical protein